MTETSCDRKRRFRREVDAKRELRKMRKRVLDWQRLRVYFCASHQAWHIGNVSFRAASCAVLGRPAGPSEKPEVR